MKRYRVKYRYGAGTSGEMVLELNSSSISEATCKLKNYCPSDVQAISVDPA